MRLRESPTIALCILHQSLMLCVSRPADLVQVGAVLLTAQHAPTERGQTIFYIVAQFVFG